jgi:hypothetical protein
MARHVAHYEHTHCMWNTMNTHTVGDSKALLSCITLAALLQRVILAHTHTHTQKHTQKHTHTHTHINSQASTIHDTLKTHKQTCTHLRCQQGVAELHHPCIAALLQGAKTCTRPESRQRGGEKRQPECGIVWTCVGETKKADPMKGAAWMPAGKCWSWTLRLSWSSLLECYNLSSRLDLEMKGV